MAEGYADEGKALDLKKLFIAYVRSIWLIGLVACIAFIAVTFYVENTPNLYTASATMYVYISNPNQVNYQYTSQSDLNTAARLMQTYMVVIRSNKVMDAVAERLGPQYSAKYIAATLSIGSVAQTEVMRVSSTTPNPQLSMEICNAVAEFAPPEIIRVVNAGSVEVIDYASLPRFADDKRMMEKSLLGALLGAMLVCGLVTVRVMFDDHITSKKDLTEHFKIPVLARIPDLKRGFLGNRDLRKKRKNALRKSKNLEKNS